MCLTPDNAYSTYHLITYNYIRWASLKERCESHWHQSLLENLNVTFQILLSSEHEEAAFNFVSPDSSRKNTKPNTLKPFTNVIFF